MLEDPTGRKFDRSDLNLTDPCVKFQLDQPKFEISSVAILEWL